MVLILEEDWRLGFAVVKPSTRYATSRRDSLVNRYLSGVAIDRGGIPIEISMLAVNPFVNEVSPSSDWMNSSFVDRLS